jgi:molybdopterin synthase catalytic subunit/molybdopterin converting factor small subunit
MPSPTIRVRLLSFGSLKTLFADGGDWRDIKPGESVAGLLVQLRDDGILPAAAMRAAAIAVNHSYASPDQILNDGDEVAILPPVSGGTEPDHPLIALVREPIDRASIDRAIKAGADGAVCVFDGIVRNHTRGRATLHLDYEAYEDMALKQMHLLRTEAIDHFGVREVAIVHRLGRLVVGETSIFIAVASAHRGPAFDACRFVIDTLKKTVPIWKKEQFVDGAVWADGEPFPDNLVRTFEP